MSFLEIETRKFTTIDYLSDRDSIDRHNDFSTKT